MILIWEQKFKSPNQAELISMNAIRTKNNIENHQQLNI